MRDGSIVGSLEAEEHDPEDLDTEGWESHPPDLDEDEDREEEEEDDLVLLTINTQTLYGLAPVSLVW